MLNTSKENQSKAEPPIYYYLDSSKPTWMAFLEAHIRQKFLPRKINRPHMEKTQKIWSSYKISRAFNAILHDIFLSKNTANTKRVHH